MTKSKDLVKVSTIINNRIMRSLDIYDLKDRLQAAKAWYDYEDGECKLLDKLIKLIEEI